MCCFDGGTVLSKEINDQLGNRDRRHIIHSLSIVEDMVVSRPKLRIATANQASLFDNIEPRRDVGLPNVQIGRGTEKKALVNLFGFGGSKGIVEAASRIWVSGC